MKHGTILAIAGLEDPWDTARDVTAVMIAWSAGEAGARASGVEPRIERAMTLLLAAVGATVAALFEVTVTTYLRIGGAQPHLVLVLAVVVTIAIGLEAGLVWAFIGGLALDVLVQRPLGSSAFTLLLCVGAAAVLGHVLARLRPLAPIVAAFVLSIGYSMTLLVVIGALRASPPIADPLPTVVPGAVYDAVIAGLVGPLAISIRDRRLQAERVDW